MAILNIGILAHVDAGKTTLTERILFETGVIQTAGSVDKGTTQTDTMELERTRGITIRSAVVSFQLENVKVNLIDTPGHSDFIAEVERSLQVLDAVVLVISAVEGVQSQTRRLAQAVRDANLPLIIFINKIDRIGARGQTLLDDIRRRLNLRVIALNDVTGAGDRIAKALPCDRDDLAWRDRLTDLLAETSERVIEEFEHSGGQLSRAFLETELRTQVVASNVVPLFFGSAVTGAGVGDLLSGIEEWLPLATGQADEPAMASVFKIQRRPSGEKVVYARLFAGRLSVRQRVVIQHRNRFGEIEPVEERITGIERFESGAATVAESVDAGDIALLHGLKAARIGDLIGEHDTEIGGNTSRFPAPALESVVRPVDPDQITHLRTALEELAEQDPLISLRQRNKTGEISVRLYGEVQKEVMEQTLMDEYGIAVAFGSSQTICTERPVGTGEHREAIGDDGNPFWASITMRVEPGEPGSGIRYHHGLGALPLAFYRAIEETVYETLAQGLSGWEVTDCTVTLNHEGYNSIMSTAGDFRKLTPLVLMRALSIAGTEVCEPFEKLDLEIPEDTFGAVCGALINARGTIRDAFLNDAWYHIVGEIPTVELPAVERQLPRLTRGEGSWVSTFATYVPVAGDPPCRDRIGPDPLNRAHYLAEVSRM